MHDAVMRTSARVFVVMLAISTSLAGCGVLDKLKKLKKGGAGAGDDGTTTTATAEPTATAPAAEPEPGASAAATGARPASAPAKAKPVGAAADAGASSDAGRAAAVLPADAGSAPLAVGPADAGSAPLGVATADAGAPSKDAGAPSGAYKVGDKIMVDWKGKAYPATVLKVVGKDLYRIHYDGYDASWDENVGPSRITGRR